MGIEDFDFYISFTSADTTWAEWVSWKLEEAEYRIYFRKWDGHPGGSPNLSSRIEQCRRMLVIASRDYQKDPIFGTEWESAWQSDPDYSMRRLVTVRIDESQLPYRLSETACAHLYGLDEEEAVRDLYRVAGWSISAERLKPSIPPTYPGKISL